MKDLKWMTWNEWIDMKELKWMTWHERIERNDWTEWMKQMNWNQELDMNELKWMTWREWIVFFYDFYVQSSSRWSLAHILSTSSSKSGLRPSVVFTNFMLNRAYVKSSSRYSLVHILSTTFRIEARNRGNRDPLVRPRTATLHEKTRGFAPGSVFSIFQPWIHTFPIAHPSQLLHDDVVDIEMMMWLPWWWDS